MFQYPGWMSAAVACCSRTVGPCQPLSRRADEGMIRIRGLTLGLLYHYAAVAFTTLRKAHASTLSQTSKYITLGAFNSRLYESVTSSWR